MLPDSNTWRMADHLAGGTLATVITSLRGDGNSYGTIARRLQSDHGIEVTSQTVCNWLKRLAVSA